MFRIMRGDCESMLEGGRRQQTIDVSERPAALLRPGRKLSPAVGNYFGNGQKITTEPTVQIGIEPLFRITAGSPTPSRS
jgi:hypothetical protein